MEPNNLPLAYTYDSRELRVIIPGTYKRQECSSLDFENEKKMTPSPVEWV